MAWWRATNAITQSPSTRAAHLDTVTSVAHDERGATTDAPRARATITEQPDAAPGVLAPPPDGRGNGNGQLPTPSGNGTGGPTIPRDDGRTTGDDAEEAPGRWWSPYPDDDAPPPRRGGDGDAAPRRTRWRAELAALAHRAAADSRRAPPRARDGYARARRRLLAVGWRLRRLDADRVRATLRSQAERMRWHGTRILRQDQRMAWAIVQATPPATGRTTRRAAASLALGAHRAVAGVWAWTETHARASWLWVRADAPVHLRRAGKRARAVAPLFSLTLIVGGTILGLLLALLIPTAVLASHVASYQPTSTKLHPLSIRSTVYAANGTTLANLGYEDRQPIAYQAISPLIVNAVVATEDRTFWTNPGVDPGGLVRAATTDLAHGAVQQGGSTITEQLVKNRIMNPKGSLQKKVTEAVLALRLNRRLTKRQIMTDYLNTVYFGEGGYGIQAATERYFLSYPSGAIFPQPIEPNQVNLAQAALLAGLIANPTTFDPFLHPDLAKARRHEVLGRMVTEGYITPAQARDADGSPLPTIPPTSPDLRPRDLWVAQVQNELLADPRLGATYADRLQLLLRGGLRVYTTLDQQAQALAQAAVNQVLPNQPPFTAALIAMDPTTGAVRAWSAVRGSTSCSTTSRPIPPDARRARRSR